MELNIPVEQLTFIRNAGETKRYHTWPTLRGQTVGEHSFHVAMICQWLAGQEPPGVGVNLILAALAHDAAEWVMGDLPAPSKRELPGYPGNVAKTANEVSYPAQSFREVWGDIEAGKLFENQLAFHDMLTDQEKYWLKLADNADGCLYCIRERAMGNKLIEPVLQNFWYYSFKLVADYGVAAKPAEYSLLDYIKAEWEKACV